MLKFLRNVFVALDTGNLFADLESIRKRIIRLRADCDERDDAIRAAMLTLGKEQDRVNRVREALNAYKV